MARAVENGPSFDDACEITPEFENEVYSYYGLQQTADTGSYRSYRSYDPPEATETTGVAGRTDVSGEEARAGQEEENPTKQPDHVTVRTLRLASPLVGTPYVRLRLKRLICLGTPRQS